jgi:hypothetical protein
MTDDDILPGRHREILRCTRNAVRYAGLDRYTGRVRDSHQISEECSQTIRLPEGFGRHDARRHTLLSYSLEARFFGDTGQGPHVGAVEVVISAPELKRIPLAIQCPGHGRSSSLERACIAAYMINATKPIPRARRMSIS